MQTTPIRLVCCALLLFIAHAAFAVWPPETTLAREQNSVSEKTGPYSPEAFQNPRVLSDLSQDERELKALLGEIKKDQEELRKLVEKKSKEEKNVQHK